MLKAKCGRRGFTLIELSIVLVIIGLIAGGVLVGQDLITAATVRAQVTQIERYNTAVRTFQGKYNRELPGDMIASAATQFGFPAGNGTKGQGDGNGYVDGCQSGVPNAVNWYWFGCENALFWADLGQAGLIDGNFSADAAFTGGNGGASILPPPLPKYLPPAKVGGGAYVMVVSNYAAGNGGVPITARANNYFTVYSLLSIDGAGGGNFYESGPFPISIQSAYNIDKKIDDGLPMSGSVQAFNYGNGGLYAPEWFWVGDAFVPPPICVTISGGAAVNTYNLNSTSSPNCALAFAFQ